MKQSTTKKQSRTYNNNAGPGQGLHNGKVRGGGNLIFLFSCMIKLFFLFFSSPASFAVVELKRKSSAQILSLVLTRWRQLSGSLTWMEMAFLVGRSLNR